MRRWIQLILVVVIFFAGFYVVRDRRLPVVRPTNVLRSRNDSFPAVAGTSPTDMLELGHSGNEIDPTDSTFQQYRNETKRMPQLEQYGNKAGLNESVLKQHGIESSEQQNTNLDRNRNRNRNESKPEAQQVDTVDRIVGNLYVCGYTDGAPEKFKPFFPFHTYVPSNRTSVDLNTIGPNDVLLALGHFIGPDCGGFRKPVYNKLVRRGQWPGKLVLINIESNQVVRRQVNNSGWWELGYEHDNRESHTIRIFFAQVVLMFFYGPLYYPLIFNPNLRPKGSKQHFLIYSASNCVQFREETAKSLSEIDTIDLGGKCSARDAENARFVYQNTSLKDNPDIFRSYRFCLVMEHKLVEGYITEKILFSFFGGCIPIWYGTREIFDVFNPDAFIYYDINDPESAFERIRYLNGNNSAYDEVMAEPILAHGNETVEKYFSLVPGVGNATLMKRIHHTLGLPVF